MVTITGGKLTTYRRMAADTIDAVADRLGVKGRSRTKKLRLVGAEGAQPADEHLRGRFGSLGADVLTLAHSDADLAAPLVPGLPYLRAEAVYAVREEMAGSLADRGELPKAIALLAKGVKVPSRPQDHHLRRMYALADLYERAGDLSRARSLFRDVATIDPDFVDVVDRVRALG